MQPYENNKKLKYEVDYGEISEGLANDLYALQQSNKYTKIVSENLLSFLTIFLIINIVFYVFFYTLFDIKQSIVDQSYFFIASILGSLISIYLLAILISYIGFIYGKISISFAKEKAKKIILEANKEHQKNIDKLNQIAKEKLDVINYKINMYNVSARKMTKREGDFSRLVSEKSTGFPYLAKAWAEYLDVADKKAEWFLTSRYKRIKAYKAAEIIHQVRIEKKELVMKYKITEKTIALYESLFPWLVEYKDPEIEDEHIQIYNENYIPSTDPSLKWITPGEYERIPVNERNQLALDRYKTGRKSKKSIGDMYERYIGYLMEEKGFEVEYTGLIKGKSDEGIDLIAKSSTKTIIIQCKLWAEYKNIHENSISQLFGSSAKYWIKKHNSTIGQMHNDIKSRKIEMWFVTSTDLTEIATEFAKLLQIEVYKNNSLDKNYPMIKCNNAHNGEKIYHLPFDQQYDKIKIRENDLYVQTVIEAEELGYRRAKRWVASWKN
jgi:Holliday junction resolvase